MSWLKYVVLVISLGVIFASPWYKSLLPVGTFGIFLALIMALADYYLNDDDNKNSKKEKLSLDDRVKRLEDKLK